jgi:hypothetical protein
MSSRLEEATLTSTKGWLFDVSETNIRVSTSGTKKNSLEVFLALSEVDKNPATRERTCHLHDLLQKTDYHAGERLGEREMDPSNNSINQSIMPMQLFRVVISLKDSSSVHAFKEYCGM